MTEKVLESTPVEPELAELAVPEVSVPDVEVERPSVTVSALTERRLQELLEKQQAALVELIDKKFQSTKDRRIGKLESKVDELLALRQEVEAAGGWDPIISQQQQVETIEARLNKILDARLSQAPASQPAADPKSAWQAEWDAESRKITDAASKLGVRLSPEEYNAALFGKKFETKGDAYAALNQALLRKGAGEAIPAAAVVTEGGDVPRLPEPKAPKDFRQQLDSALVKGDDKAAREALDAEWAKIEKMQALEKAKTMLADSNISPQELIE